MDVECYVTCDTAQSQQRIWRHRRWFVRSWTNAPDCSDRSHHVSERDQSPRLIECRKFCALWGS